MKVKCWNKFGLVLMLISVFAGYWLVIRQKPIVEQKKEIVIQDDKLPAVPTVMVRDKPLDYPFTVQAPTAEWDNSIFQDGCEEAAVLMAKCSMFKIQCPIENGIIDKNWAREQIVKMSEWQEEKYGSSVDTSADDTAERLLKKYGGITNYEVKRVKEADLKTGIWIVPMDGRKLGNPYYTAPGPERHMVLVIGYDPKTNEVITNDAGTKRGKNYRYKLDVFWNAIRDYPTGDHLPITEINKNAILVTGLASG